jgi:hypothetical protein
MIKPTKIALVLSNYPALELYCPNWNGMQDGLRALNIPFKFFTCRPNFNPAEVVEYQPDLIVYGLIDVLKEQGKCLMIRKALPNAKIVLWYGDYRDKRSGYLQGNFSRLIDAMFVSNDAQSEFWKTALHISEVHYLPLGCTPIEKPEYVKKFDMPFIFVGGLNGSAPYVDRMLFVKELMNKSELKIVSSYESCLRKKIYQAMPKLYSSARVTLDISHFTDVQGYTSNRYFIIPAFYGLPITKRFPGCEELYPSSIRPYFDTVDEALELKDYYLSHPKEREKKVEELHKWSYNHTYDKRWKRMFDLL